MHRLAQLQHDHNVQTADGWERFAEHRRRVTQILCREPGGRLCVLGAGNCNDLDLAALAEAYEEVHLVDLDEDALRKAVARQQPPHPDRVHLHGCEVTGILDQLADWTPHSAARESEVDSAIKAALAVAAPLSLQSSHVASICLLSQLIHSLVLSLGETHPKFVELMSALRLRHLQLLGELTLPGGRATLVSDVVSSDTCPAIKSVTDEQVAPLVRQAIDQRNFFHGTNPAVIVQTLRTDAVLAPLVRDLELIPPWRWDLGPRTYAVYGIGWTRPGG